MNIEKLIEAAKLYGIDAADALTAPLAENERLQKMYQEEKWFVMQPKLSWSG